MFQRGPLWVASLPYGLAFHIDQLTPHPFSKGMFVTWARGMTPLIPPPIDHGCPVLGSPNQCWMTMPELRRVKTLGGQSIQLLDRASAIKVASPTIEQPAKFDDLDRHKRPLSLLLA